MASWSEKQKWIREIEADKARTENYNHRLAENLKNGVSRNELERDFLATFGGEYRYSQSDVSNSEPCTVANVAALMVPFVLLALIILGLVKCG